MAIIRGGIFGTVSGKAGDEVFSFARAREGKVNTVRRYVIPKNPRTAAQTIQRNKFLMSQEITRRLGSDVYADDWNRAIGQLPGYQSMMSIFLGAAVDADTMGVPADTNLGTLPITTSFAVDPASADGQITITWSTTVPDGGTAADEVKIFVVEQDPGSDGQHQCLSKLSGLTRSTGTTTLTGCVSGASYTCCAWMVGAGVVSGKLSKARWFEGDAGD